MCGHGAPYCELTDPATKCAASCGVAEVELLARSSEELACSHPQLEAVSWDVVVNCFPVSNHAPDSYVLYACANVQASANGPDAASILPTAVPRTSFHRMAT